MEDSSKEAKPEGAGTKAEPTQAKDEAAALDPTLASPVDTSPEPASPEAPSPKPLSPEPASPVDTSPEASPEAASPKPLSPEAAADSGGIAGRGLRKRNPVLRLISGLLKLLLGVVALLVLAAAILLAIAAFDRRDPLDALPDGFDAYVRADSATRLATDLISLEAADYLLASRELAPVRAAVLALRSAPLLRSPLLRRLADVRIDAALFPGGGFVALVDLGLRSAATRPLMLAAPLAMRFVEVEGLDFVDGEGPARFVYKAAAERGAGAFAVHVTARRNLLIVASSEALLTSALDGGKRREGQASLKAALDQKPAAPLRFLVRPEAWVSGLRGANDALASILSSLRFPDYASLDLDINNASIQIAAALPVASDDPALGALVDSRSAAPAISALYPASLRWSSVLAAGSPEALVALAAPHLGPSFAEILEQADGAAKLAFGEGLDALLYNWAGGELGALGLGEGVAPVYFLRVADERARRKAFDAILGSLLANPGRAAEIEGVRLERADFPWYIDAILESAGVRVPEPWYFEEKGFLFLSESPAALAELGKSIREGSLLARTERWKRSGGAVSAAAAVQIVYSLSDAIPFFLRGSGPAAEALRRYGSGVATARFDGGVLRLALAAQASAGRGLGAAPGFPLKAEGRLSSSALALERPGSPALLYWLEDGATLVEYESASGRRLEAALDDEAEIIVESGTAVWATSRRGMIYRFLPGLVAAPGFPLASGREPSSPPALGGERLYLPVRSPTGILAISRDGMDTLLGQSFEAPLLAPPAWRQGRLALYPKRFDGLVHLWNEAGEEAPGWPLAAPGLGFGSPFFAREGDATRLGFLAQSGELYLWPLSGAEAAADPSLELPETVPGAESLLLEGVFYAQALYAPRSRAVWALAEDGRLWRLEADGGLSSLAPDDAGSAARFPRGKEAAMVLRDVDGDGREDVFIYGSGGSVAAAGSDLRPLAGFPVAGGRRPSFADLDGDGRAELISAGFDGKIYAYKFER